MPTDCLSPPGVGFRWQAFRSTALQVLGKLKMHCLVALLSPAALVLATSQTVLNLWFPSVFFLNLIFFFLWFPSLSGCLPCIFIYRQGKESFWICIEAWLTEFKLLESPNNPDVKWGGKCLQAAPQKAHHFPHTSVGEIQASAPVSTGWCDRHSARHCAVSLVAGGLACLSLTPTCEAETADQVCPDRPRFFCSWICPDQNMGRGERGHGNCALHSFSSHGEETKTGLMCMDQYRIQQLVLP